MASDLTKATWANIRSGAALPPSDNSDVQPSGEASENSKPPHTAADYPESSANRKTTIGENGKMIGYKKAQATLMKALEDPEITKSLDHLEKAGVLKMMSDLEKAEVEASTEAKAEEVKEDEPEAEHKMYKGPSPADVAQIVKMTVGDQIGSLAKQVSDLTKAFTNSQKAPDLQKAGFVEVSSTAKPNLEKAEMVSAGSPAASRLQKAADSNATDETPSFDDLAGRRLGDARMV